MSASHCNQGACVEKIATEKISLRVADGSEMGAYVARPAGGGKHPGLLVFQEAFGVNTHIRDVTERFAREGYVAIAPELYHRTAPPDFVVAYSDFASVKPHMQAMTEPGMISDIRAAFDWLQNDPHTSSAKIASIGFCLGGRVSFLACATVPLHAAVSFYGGGIAPAMLSRVSELHAPMLFFWGGLDKHIGQDQIRAVIDEFKKANKAYVNVEFSDADHGFFCDARPSYHAAAATLAWNLSKTYLHIHSSEMDERSRLL
jgi:carboxymethylenebutenolidase